MIPSTEFTVISVGRRVNGPGGLVADPGLSSRVAAKSNGSFSVALQAKKTAKGRGEERKSPENLAVVFVDLASLAIGQGWIGRAEMPH